MPIHSKKQAPTEILRFGIDYLRLNFDKDFPGVFFDSLYQGLSQNSTEIFYNIYGLLFQLRLKEVKGKRVLDFFHNGDHVITLEKIMDGGISKTVPWCLIFEGTFFYVPAVQIFMEEVLSRYGRFAKISRIDLCLDIPQNTARIADSVVTVAQAKSTIEKKDGLETMYIGAKTWLNKRHFIRVYDKKKDIQKKGKYHLFIEYLSLPEATRIEVQINVISCETFKIQISDIVDFFEMQRRDLIFESRLYQLWKRCCANKSTTYFKKLDLSLVKIKRVRVDMSQKNKILDELPYAKIMLGYAQRLHSYGFDVISYLKDNLKDV